MEGIKKALLVHFSLNTKSTDSNIKVLKLADKLSVTPLAPKNWSLGPQLRKKNYKILNKYFII